MAKGAFSASYLDGVSVALVKLAEWEKSLPTPKQMSTEIRACLLIAPNDKRDGFSETIAAFVICCMGGARPIAGRWNVMEDLCDDDGARHAHRCGD